MWRHSGPGSRCTSAILPGGPSAAGRAPSTRCASGRTAQGRPGADDVRRLRRLRSRGSPGPAGLEAAGRAAERAATTVQRAVVRADRLRIGRRLQSTDVIDSCMRAASNAAPSVLPHEPNDRGRRCRSTLDSQRVCNPPASHRRSRVASWPSTRPSQEKNSASRPTGRYEHVGHTSRASTSSPPPRVRGRASQHSGWIPTTTSSRSSQPAATPATVASASHAPYPRRPSPGRRAGRHRCARPARQHQLGRPSALRIVRVHHDLRRHRLRQDDPAADGERAGDRAAQ